MIPEKKKYISWLDLYYPSAASPHGHPTAKYMYMYVWPDTIVLFIPDFYIKNSINIY